MSGLRRLRLEMLLLTILAIVAFAVSQRSIGLMLAACGLAAASWYVTEGPRGRTLPRWGSTVVVILIVLNAVREWFERPDPSEAMAILGRFATWLAVLKLYEGRSLRDDAQLLALSAVLVVSGTMHSIDLLFALLLLIYGVAAMRVAMLLQIGRVERAAQRRSPALAAAGAPRAEAAQGRRFAGQWRRTVAVAVTGATLLSIVVFLLFPRRLDAESRRPTISGAPVAGFRDEVDLLSGDRISESRREVFSVRWLDRAGESVEFPRPMLLRGSVMEEYLPAQAKWTASASRRRIRTVTTRPDGTSTPLSQPPVEPRSETYRQQVTMRSTASDTIFAAWAPIAVSTPDRRSLGVDLRTLVMREVGLERLSRLQFYEVQVEPFPGPETLGPLFREIGSRIGPLPEFPVPRVREIAQRILGEIDPQELAEIPDAAAAEASPEARWERNRRLSRIFLAALRDGSCRYTTDLRDFVRIRDEDPIVSFLDRYRFGHCEYFASALAALCQSVGVDARMVTGYIAMEFDPGTRQYLVRESNAHAWVEVRTGNFLWTTLDPTPPETLEAFAAARRSWLDRWRWVYDRVELFWNSRIVSFDGVVQASLAERMTRTWSARLDRLNEAVQQGFGRFARQFSLGGAAVPWLVASGLGAVAAALAVVIAIRRRRRLRRLVGAGGAPLRRDQIAAAAAYLEAVRLWRRAGHPKPAWIPPQAFLQTLPPLRRAAVEATEPIVALFYRSRFGGLPAEAPQLREVREQLVRLRRLLA